MNKAEITSQCVEGRHDLCLGYYGTLNANMTCQCSCHKGRNYTNTCGCIVIQDRTAGALPVPQIVFCHKHDAAPDMYEALKLAESFLDKHNGEHGNEKELCLCCHSKTLDGIGIKHEPWCPIQQSRKALAKAEGMPSKEFCPAEGGK